MASIREYHRPGNVDEALALLNRAEATSVILGGGTTVVPDHAADPVEVIDLQALPLGDIAPDGSDRTRIGAMTRLQQLVDDAAVPDLIRNAAHREAPRTIRNAATVGGTVAEAHWESGMVAALLVQGLTNSEIADELTVAPKTVERHVGNILSKLGFERRAQVAAWAVDKGLAEAPEDLDTLIRD